MFARYFVALCAVAFCAVAVNAGVDVAPTQDVDTQERANPAVTIVAKIIGYLFKSAAKSCLGEAAQACSSQWKNPGAAITCAKNFLEANKGRCAVGK